MRYHPRTIGAFSGQKKFGDSLYKQATPSGVGTPDLSSFRTYEFLARGVTTVEDTAMTRHSNAREERLVSRHRSRWQWIFCLGCALVLITGFLIRRHRNEPASQAVAVSDEL